MAFITFALVATAYFGAIKPGCNDIHGRLRLTRIEYDCMEKPHAVASSGVAIGEAGEGYF